MNTLTDRYVWAVVRLLPESQRAEIDAELRSLVADMIDASDGVALERDVLRELGDPGRMAASYVERPRALIGPHVFPEYVRVLELVASIVLPIAVVVSVLSALLADDPDVGSVIGSVAAGLSFAVVHVGFWVTLTYAFADRWKADNPWTVDALPDVPAGRSSNGVNLTDAALSIVFTVLFGVALIWQQVRSPLRSPDGERVPFLHEDVWGSAGLVLLAVLAASLTVEVIVLVRRHWTLGLAVSKVALNVGFLAVVAWLALDDRLVNTEFMQALAVRAEWDVVPSVNPWIPIGIVAAIEVWDSIECIRSVRRKPVASPFT